MIGLVLTCVVIAAALIAIVGLWHRRAPAIDALALAKAQYEGFVVDVERREGRGDIDAELANEERVEAARALLKAEAAATPAYSLKPAHAAIGAFAVAGISFALYALYIGHPELGDQPYETRVVQWTDAARRNIDSLPPEALSAVLHRRASEPDNVKNPDFWLFLGKVDMMAGRYYEAAKAFDTSMKLSPKTFTGWSDLGEALYFVAGGSVGPDSQKAFDLALAQDPKDARAHYYLGRRDLDQGRYDSARAHFVTAKAALAVDDIRQNAIAEQLAAVETAQSGEAAARTRIAGMVAALEAQLTEQPDNADGWARLLRSYDVMGDAAGKARVLKEMQAHYRDRPQVAADIVQKSKGAVGAENTGGQ
ncbi:MULTISPECIES: c-type cytochrome biogenesis protein CcmI [Asticcacaulis]|uniref:c-type cytochrome biogenesis protein CcmI n=1 Tax=Asticcacaulis TaxID=76890 RepID=UPI001AE7BF73|nr:MULTISPECIES: c-type cytochrome biogenesis protein CcmI [Asticcacaulis]MBP2157775.1 cytochrome c-type biogenesis protein CcmH [Asticcacaulis solisilvae]MDR6798820.1 cytochrome c-type biogenesis protein CcmH [Asticcacaulis sp. BE141]